MIITIDGPAGSGKSSVAKLLAKQLNLLYLDSGALYRQITANLITQKVAMSDLSTITKIAHDTSWESIDETIIRSTEVSELVSEVAKIAIVRELALNKQRLMAQKYSNIIVEGRDTGSVVFPEANFKFFLTASLETRAKRRFSENQAKALEVDFIKIKTNIEKRDRSDSQRKQSPLVKPKEAHEIDTTGLSLSEVSAIMIRIISDKKK